MRNQILWEVEYCLIRQDEQGIWIYIYKPEPHTKVIVT